MLCFILRNKFCVDLIAENQNLEFLLASVVSVMLDTLFIIIFCYSCLQNIFQLFCVLPTPKILMYATSVSFQST